MTQTQLYTIASDFREAIVKAKEAGAFNPKYRMSRFPHGCGDDTADLFAHYLYNVYDIDSIRIDGTFRDGNPEYTCGHSWQIVDGYIVDLTGSQFRYDSILLNYDVDVYVGEKDDFHRLFEVETTKPIAAVLKC